MTGTALVLLALVIGISSWIVAVILSEPVSFERLDSFARRQRLPITPANAAIVMRYVATTHRWRTAGLATAACYTVAAGLRHHRLTADLLAMFVGWFVGAVVAEWRLNAPPPGARRRARLTPRSRGTYLGVGHRALPWITTALTLGVGIVNLIYQAGNRYAPRPQTISFILMAVLSITTAVVVGRHVVLRAQPAVLDDDVRAADDALRARSLRVLSGSTVALTMTAAASLIMLSPQLEHDTACAVAITILALGSLTGWYLAAAPAPWATAAPPPPEAEAATP
jgi:hypothetical protein